MHVQVYLVTCARTHTHGLHPLSCQEIYKCIVLPKSLYGCENWNNMTVSDVFTMERAHRFCIKYMQGLHRRTRTDIALSMIAIYSIESEIDFKKLILFGQLCRLNFEHWIRVVFLNRVCSYSINGTKQIDFIPDIVSILGKYSLLDVLTAYRRDGVFPSRLTWNKREGRRYRNVKSICGIVRHCSQSLTDSNAYIVIMAFILFGPFQKKKYPKLTTAAKSITQMISFLAIDADNARLCYKCNMIYFNIVDHCISECPCVHSERVCLWDKILQFNPDVYILLRGLDKEQLTNVFLGEALADLTALLSEDLALFWYLCLPVLHT